MKLLAFMSLVLLSLLAPATRLRADAPSQLVDLVSSDVIAIGYVNLDELRQSGIVERISGEGGMPMLPPGVSDVIAGSVQELTAAGVDRIDLLLRVADIQHQSPIWVFSGNGSDAAQLCVAVQALFAKFAPMGLPQSVQVKGSFVLAGESDVQLSQFSEALDRGSRDRDLAQPLAQTDSPVAGMLLIGDQDSRRVLRETFPQLPAPFPAIDGKILADDVSWCHVAVQAGEAPRLEVVVKTRKPAAAQVVGEAVSTGVELLQKQLSGMMPDLELPAELIESKVTEDSVTIQLGHTAPSRAILMRVIGGQIMTSQAAAHRSQRMNQVRQLVLAMLNYEGTHGTIVQPANYDADGRPLLSWRVHLLPYLAEEKLYKEFRLDEPWDSPHNHKLIERMPVAVFGNPDPQIQARLEVGRTMWVLPVGNETAFPPRETLPDGEPLKIRDIKDGTSHTIAIVETLPDRAVIWTKPDDWQVDLANPWDGVVSPERDGFVAARCDGSAQFYTAEETTVESWRALLTRAAGDRP